MASSLFQQAVAGTPTVSPCGCATVPVARYIMIIHLYLTSFRLFGAFIRNFGTIKAVPPCPWHAGIYRQRREQARLVVTSGKQTYKVCKQIGLQGWQWRADALIFDSRLKKCGMPHFSMRKEGSLRRFCCAQALSHTSI